jgi:cephalosporin-C deacetylase-like acetyl esterase
MIVALLALLQTAQELRDLDPVVERRPQALEEELRAGIREANDRASKAWREIKSREDWEKFRDEKIAALRASLGAWPAPPADLRTKIHGSIDGDGYRIENLTYESRPGLLVTANLYSPLPARPLAPGILIIHSHHNPRTQSELQDMGVLWARAGCRVLVMDQLGHGERRQHPFVDASSFPSPFRAGRQDYWFRYNTNAQLALLGESLIGWMAWDVMRGVDLLLALPGTDPARILLLGSVAGGGDPAGVAAALDPRITGVVPFNFGGPQPESKYPLPDDAETSFNYAGGGSWESTRNLAFSARDGFLPWVVVASVAPRALVHAHEFSWDRERDPVWKRYQAVWGFYGKTDRLSFAHGYGVLSGQPPNASHCNNIGADHRKGGIYAAFETMFAIPAPAAEPKERRPAADLLCKVPLKPLHEILAEAVPKTARSRDELAAAWTKLLADVSPLRAEAVELAPRRFVLQADGARIPCLLFVPPGEGRRPAVVAVAQGGKAGFLKHRADEIAALLADGVAVCLADLRGTGDTRSGDGVGRTSPLTSLSATSLMLGRPLPGVRVRELRSVLAWLRGRSDVDPGRLALWGDSFAPANGPGVRVDVPYDAPKFPDVSHPMGAMTVLLTALYEPGLKAVYARGGLESWASVLKSPFLHVPHDAFVPGALLAGDLPAVAGALGATSDGSVDGLNRPAGPPASGSDWLKTALRR